MNRKCLYVVGERRIFCCLYTFVQTCTKDGHKQTTKTSTKIQTKRTKKHRTTEEEMEGPTSSAGSRNRLTCLTLQEHDDDDDDVPIFVF